MGLETIAANYRKQQMKDPFFKYFKKVTLPTSGKSYYQRRMEVRPTETRSQAQARLGGISREAADIYKKKTGSAYKGTLLPVAKDSTYAKSSYAPKAKAKGSSQKKAKTLRTQRSLFGGNVRDLMPSQRRDLTRRRAAKKQTKKTKKTLGV